MSDFNRGGPGRGQGRKPVKQGEPTVTVSLRMTAAQREKLSRIGGAAWVRQNIDAAAAPWKRCVIINNPVNSVKTEQTN